MLKAGFCAIDITPQKPYPMAGFDLRKEPNTGVHDPIAARAIVLDDGTSCCAICSIETLGVPEYMVADIRRIVSETLPIPAKAIQISAIHTHAAPQSIFRTFACYDPAYFDFVVQSAVSAIEQAYQNRHEVTATYAHTTVSGVASYRDRIREESAYDMPCDTLLLTAPNAAQKDILLTVYACHPTVLNEANFLVSRDLVYGCEKALKQSIDADVLFLNGACADLSTRFTRQNATFEEAERLGSIWADAIQSALQTAQPLEGTIRFDESALFIPPARFFNAEEREEVLAYLEKKIEACTDAAQKREYIACRSVLQRKNYGTATGCDATLRIIALGDVVFCSLPFEYASVDADRLKAAFDEKFGTRCIVCCYSNGYEGYLPSGRPVDRDSGYEDIASTLRSDAKQLVAEAFERMLFHV